MSETIDFLIIDDSPGDARLVGETLGEVETWDSRVSYAHSAAEAKQAVCREMPDIALVDFNLGPDTAPELISDLRSHGFAGPVIVLTGLGSEDTATASFRSGASDYIPKTRLTGRSILRSVSNALEKHRLAVELRRQREELQATNDHLERRNREVSQFYHQVSHELRTPLTAAREFVSMTLEGLAGDLEEEQQEFLSVAQRNCDHMIRCLDDLIDSTKLDTKKLKLSPSPVEVSPLLRTTVRSLEPLARPKRITLRIEADDSIGAIEADPDRFVQILNNLVANAVKFSPEGSEVLVSAAEGDGFVEFRVTDSGCGIAPEEVDRIFERLYQVRSDGLSTGSGGLGLGLHVCRELVGLHGGRIGVESRPGEGSTFSFTIPTTTREVPA